MKLQCNKTVRAILTLYPETRDNDNLLLLKVWETEDPELENKFYTYFSNMFLSGKLSHFESVRRTRQKLQQEYPHLRGKRYIERQTKQKEETEQELGYVKTPFGAPGTTP